MSYVYPKAKRPEVSDLEQDSQKRSQSQSQSDLVELSQSLSNVFPDFSLHSDEETTQDTPESPEAVEETNEPDVPAASLLETAEDKLPVLQRLEALMVLPSWDFESQKFQEFSKSIRGDFARDPKKSQELSKMDRASSSDSSSCGGDSRGMLDKQQQLPKLGTFLFYLQARDALQCRADRVLHIQVPEGVGADWKVRVLVRNMLLELEVPEGSRPGDVVACHPPTTPPMSPQVQRRLLASVLLCHLRSAMDEGPGGRIRCKLEAFRAMRGRSFGSILPPMPENDSEDDRCESP